MQVVDLCCYFNDYNFLSLSLPACLHIMPSFSELYAFFSEKTISICCYVCVYDERICMKECKARDILRKCVNEGSEWRKNPRQGAEGLFRQQDVMSPPTSYIFMNRAPLRALTR